MAYPALVSTADFAMSLVSPHGTAGNVAYSQGDLPVVLQIASITGLWGISFLLSLVASALSVAWLHRRDRRIAAYVLALAAAPLAVALLFFVAPLVTEPGETHG